MTVAGGHNRDAGVEVEETISIDVFDDCAVAARGDGAIIEDVDGNRFLDFNAGIAVVATGHCHPRVVRAIQEQAARLIHMSGTDFYYEELVALAERLAALSPGGV